MNVLIDDVRALPEEEQVAYCLALLEIVLEDSLTGTLIYAGADRAAALCWDILRDVPADIEDTFFNELENSDDVNGFYYLMNEHGRTPALLPLVVPFGSCASALATLKLEEETYLPYFLPTEPPVDLLVEMAVNDYGKSVADLTTLKANLESTFSLATLTRVQARGELSTLGLI